MTASSGTQSLGLLALRLILGVTFIKHGWNKVTDLSGTEQFFVSLGIPLPALAAPVAAFTEVIGGGLLILGLLTPLIGLALAFDMAVALFTVHADNGFFVEAGGYEFVLLLGLASLALVLTGPGRFSLDAAMGLRARVPRRGGDRRGQRATA